MSNQESLVVSIILPCRNEAKSIRLCLESVVTSDFPKGKLELLVVDGQSDDGTIEIVREFCARHPWIRLLTNARRITPAGMNVGIRSAAGKIVIRMDAHTVYPPDYVSKLVEWIERSKADNVGGVCATRPANQSAKAHAIAFALSHPWGVGDSHFRIGATAPKWVDTVPFGCYRREVFDKIGLYDEALVRNQDDELNHRLIKHGGRILLVPEIVSFYTARESLGKVWAMYYQYGYFKPLAVRRIGAVMTARQLVPATFVMSLVLTASLAHWSSTARVLFGAIVTAYVVLDVIVAFHAAFERDVRCGLWSVVVFPLIHISYGIGYLKGLLDFLILRKGEPLDPLAVPLSR
ncbi:MAG: glycosyltransferase family 2 protein [Nitrospira sp.]|nr:glycosyltransferase family 2 protein [Nitrospira sp.]MDH4244005.1 glycosyltransferase family 2 protein [Nitrospira sp.]MDH4355877.1 glycosyltransferase family 2 protein [Nitrospira sp.]MDH5317909.1 glycosyltransferase family 2 protein [Nitrospira sp.]